MKTARTMTSTRDRADRRAADRAARQEHRRLSREKLVALRKTLRDAIMARTRGMKELAAAARAERGALRSRLREMRVKALGDVRERAQAARRAADAACIAKKREASETCDTAIAYARAAVAAEQQRRTEEKRIAHDERADIAAIERAHESGAVHHHMMRSALLGQLGPLYERIRHAAPGESRAEAVLRYAEAHPDEAHALVAPGMDRAITAAKTSIAEVERSANAPTASQLAQAHRSHLARKRGRKASLMRSATTTTVVPIAGGLGRAGIFRGVPMNENGDDTSNRYAVRWTAADGRASWVLQDDDGGFGHTRAWVGSHDNAEERARALNAKSADGTVYEAQVFSGALERERLLALARRPQPPVKAPELEDTAEIAKRIRDDIKAAVAANELPRARYSVQTKTYSMSSTIHVEASKLPFPVRNPEAFRVRKGETWVSFDREHFTSRFTPEAQSVLTKLEAIVNAYHWDRSDPVTDYYNARFHRTVRVTEDAAMWKAIAAAKVEAARRDP